MPLPNDTPTDNPVTDNPAIVTGAPIKSHSVVQAGATLQLREESNGQGRGVLERGTHEV
ncbi:MAG: hypothetical protein ABSG32_09510 [Terriglobia bacterium]